MRVRVEQVLLPPAVSAGMNPYVLMSLAYLLRSTTEDPPPIHVTREGDYYRIHDGRHRFVAAVLAGRPDVLAELYIPQ
jgi:hypothetical protein